MANRSLSRWSIGPAILASLALVGCSSDPDTIAAVPASGTVTLKGKPLESGNIQFAPEKGRSASGAIKDGKFTMTTYEPNDGAIPGRHSVVVTAYKEVQARGMTEPTQELVTPVKYSNAASSGLSVEIPAGGKTDITFDLQ